METIKITSDRLIADLGGEIIRDTRDVCPSGPCGSAFVAVDAECIGRVDEGDGFVYRLYRLADGRLLEGFGGTVRLQSSAQIVDSVPDRFVGVA